MSVVENATTVRTTRSPQQQIAVGSALGALVRLGASPPIFRALPAAVAGYVYLALPGWRGVMETLEHYGFFHAESYKGNQGVRVRRGSIAGILAIGASGIITMVTHRLFGYERVDFANDWYWAI